MQAPVQADHETRPPDDDIAVSAAQVRVAFDAAPKNQIAGIVCASCMWLPSLVVHGTTAWRIQTVVWYVLVAGTLLLDRAIVTRYRKLALSDAETLRYARWVARLWILNGAAWGSSAWLMLPTTHRYELLVYVFMAGCMAGASSAKLNYGPFRTHLVSMVLVFATGVARSLDFYQILLAVLYVGYAITIINAGMDREKSVRRMIRLARTNELLLSMSKQQHREALLAKEGAEQARTVAEAADRAKSTFIAAASHDLRQPLHALVQYVDHLKRNTTDRENQSTIGRIEESVDAVAQLLNAILDFSKISMGAVEPRPEPVSVAALLHRMDTQLAPVAATEGVRLRFEGRDVWVESDPALLERVIRNLTLNAVRYAGRGNVVVRAKPVGASVQLSVSDDGIGIARAEQRRIFEAYYQAANPGRDRRKGLGLGLAVVKDLCALLAVPIRLRSTPGRGTTFRIVLPLLVHGTALAAAQFRRGDEASDDDDRVRGAAVMLIDDDDLARQALGVTLDSFGCRVVQAGSTEEALQRLDSMEFPLQCVVSDYRLAQGTGLIAIGAVDARQRLLYGPDHGVPGLIVSGDTSKEELTRVARAGFPMLHKPVAPMDLRRALNRILGGVTV